MEPTMKNPNADNAFDEGRVYKSAEQRRREGINKSTIRLRLDPRQLCLTIQLVENLGGSTEGRTLASVAQFLFQSLLESKLKEGVITDISMFEASKILLNRRAKVIPNLDIGQLSLIDKPKPNKDFTKIAQEALDAVQNKQHKEDDSDELFDILGLPENF